MVLVKYMLVATGQITPGQWHPFVAVREGASASMAYAHIAAIVNASIYISLVFVWIGLGIGIATETWKFMRQLRKGSPTGAQAAPLQVH
jgi:hypothetical protein